MMSQTCFERSCMESNWIYTGFYDNSTKTSPMVWTHWKPLMLRWISRAASTWAWR